MQNQTQKGKEFVRRYNKFKNEHGAFGGSVAVLEDTKLSCQAKVLFNIIASYCFVRGHCSAVTITLAKKIGRGKTSIYAYLQELEVNKLVILKQVETSNGPRRHIYLDFDCLDARYKDNIN